MICRNPALHRANRGLGLWFGIRLELGGFVIHWERRPREGGREGGGGRGEGKGRAGGRAHGNGLAPQHDEVVGALHEKAGEFVRDDRVHLVYLLDLHANPTLRRAAHKGERAAVMAGIGGGRGVGLASAAVSGRVVGGGGAPS